VGSDVPAKRASGGGLLGAIRGMLAAGKSTYQEVRGACEACTGSIALVKYGIEVLYCIVLECIHGLLLVLAEARHNSSTGFDIHVAGV
jgi:hypothetical protein